MDQETRAGSAGVGGDGFVFDERHLWRRITDPVILDGLRRFAAERPGTLLTARDFNRWKKRPCSSALVIDRFGTWRQALRRAGVRAPCKAARWTPEELMDTLESLWRAKHKPPTEEALGRVFLSVFPFIRIWGSLDAARTLLARYKRGEIDREELLHPIAAPPERRHRIPRAMRYEVLKRDHFRCVKCGRGPHSTPPAELEADHIKPESKGGETVPENLQTLCRDCNRGKGNRE